MKRIVHVIDAIVRWAGTIFAWAMPILMIVIVGQVVGRYGFKASSIKLEELQWHLYGAAVMIGLSYTLLHDAHIRVDVFRHRFSYRAKAVIDIAGTLLLLFPFLIFLFWQSLSYVGDSLGERSDAPGGLPLRWAIKVFIPLGCLMLFLAGVSHLIRCVGVFLRKG